jgi:hypothetical protein
MKAVPLCLWPHRAQSPGVRGEPAVLEAGAFLIPSVQSVEPAIEVVRVEIVGVEVVVRHLVGEGEGEVRKEDRQKDTCALVVGERK